MLYLILIGLFGVGGTGSDEISGGHDDEQGADYRGFLKRTDAFMFSIWFFTLYAMLNSMVLQWKSGCKSNP